VVTYFKDLSTSCILRKGDEFWGKNYFSPAGFKAALMFRFPNLMSKDIEVGGFYARTIKNCYQEYGFKTAVAFAF
jgi:Na+-transporting NADH:ubiquinone oxidoreductase subunit NqrB